MRGGGFFFGFFVCIRVHRGPPRYCTKLTTAAAPSLRHLAVGDEIPHLSKWISFEGYSSTGRMSTAMILGLPALVLFARPADDSSQRSIKSSGEILGDTSAFRSESASGSRDCKKGSQERSKGDQTWMRWGGWGGGGSIAWSSTNTRRKVFMPVKTRNKTYTTE